MPGTISYGTPAALSALSSSESRAKIAGKLGRTFVKTGRFEPTTQTCHRCGHRQGMPLEVRTFVCEGCGHTEDRDLNAAKNILWRGQSLRGVAGVPAALHREPVGL